jgi:hypothetical protein
MTFRLVYRKKCRELRLMKSETPYPSKRCEMKYAAAPYMSVTQGARLRWSIRIQRPLDHDPYLTFERFVVPDCRSDADAILNNTELGNPLYGIPSREFRCPVDVHAEEADASRGIGR